MDTAAGVKLAVTIVMVAIIVVYVAVWTPLAIVMLLIWEGPKNWIGWLVIVGNPFLLTFLVALVQRRRIRKNENG